MAEQNSQPDQCQLRDELALLKAFATGLSSCLGAYTLTYAAAASTKTSSATTFAGEQIKHGVFRKRGDISETLSRLI